MKKQLRNQPDRMGALFRHSLRAFVGKCPSCSHSGVIYRQSQASITFRCKHCALQWTMTWLTVNRSAKAQLAEEKDKNIAMFFSTIAQATEPAVDREAMRESSIKKNLSNQFTRRSVIRLPNGPANMIA
jgi:hypothetical protein